jgi:DnaJ family protein C protein 28
MADRDEVSETPDWTFGVAERKIQEAIDQGLFDNLPGRGQPLDLSVNPFETPGMGAFNRLLKNNKVLPTWLTLEQEIERSRATALAVLSRWELVASDLRGTEKYPARRDAVRADYAKHLRETNDLILKFNLSSPFQLRVPIPFQIAARLRDFDERYGEST